MSLCLWAQILSRTSYRYAHSRIHQEPTLIENCLQSTDATVVTRILEAGGHITGKAVCENMCHSGTSHSAATGKVENPYVKGYSSGGSSSGCGVLVALGEVDAAVGADQGGSVRWVYTWRAVQ